MHKPTQAAGTSGGQPGRPARREGLRLWLPILISAAALGLSLFNTGASLARSRLEAVFRPLNFEVSRGAQTVVYQISDAGGSTLLELPGYETSLSCQTGAYQEFTQIYYDGINLEMASADMDVLESGDYVIQSKGQIPPGTYAPGETAYDYCFVRTVAASGQRALWLIYYELDLAENTVRGPFRAGDTILLSLESPTLESAKAEMLRNYQALCEMVDALPGS